MQKTINFLKLHKITILIVLITFLGFLLRLDTGVDILTIDEIATFRTAMQSFPHGIIDALTNKNLHAPLYYFILHFWMKLFGTDIFTLKLLPILIGTLCIPVSYLCAKILFPSPKFEVATALLVAMNPFLIILSNFAKFYSLLHLLGFLSILFLFKTKQKPKTLNITLLAVTNALIIYTFVLGILFVLIQFMFFIAYLYSKKEPKILKNFLIKYPLILFLLTLPIIQMIFVIITKTQNGLIRDLWWYTFCVKDTYRVFYSWFSPALAEIVRPESSIEPPRIIILNIISFLIAYWGMVKALIKRNFVSLLLCISFVFIFAELTGAIRGQFAFCTRYTSVAFPAIILAVAYGLSLIKNLRIFLFLILNLCLINLASKDIDMENFYHLVNYDFQSITNILKANPPAKNDFIIMPFRGYYLEAYYNLQNTNFISFDLNYAYISKDKDVLKNILNLDYIKPAKLDSHKRFNNYLRTKTPSKELSDYLNKQCFSKLHKNDRVYLILPDMPDFSILDKIIKDENFYNKQNIFILLLTKINYDLIKITNKKLLPEVITVNNGCTFTIRTYKKL